MRCVSEEHDDTCVWYPRGYATKIKSDSMRPRGRIKAGQGVLYPERGTILMRAMECRAELALTCGGGGQCYAVSISLSAQSRCPEGHRDSCGSVSWVRPAGRGAGTFGSSPLFSSRGSGYRRDLLVRELLPELHVLLD